MSREGTLARQWNERVKLTMSAMSNLSTGTALGAIILPLASPDTATYARSPFWLLGSACGYLTALGLAGFPKDEG